MLKNSHLIHQRASGAELPARIRRGEAGDTCARVKRAARGLQVFRRNTLKPAVIRRVILARFEAHARLGGKRSLPDLFALSRGDLTALARQLANANAVLRGEATLAR